MAAPPKLKGLLKEDFPEAPEWFGKLAETLNPFLSDTGAALSGRLSLSDNVACSVDTFKFTMPATDPYDWQTFAFSNSWVDASSLGNPVAGYRLTSDGKNVQFRGAIKNGTAVSGTPFATLPAGYRPTGKHVYLLITSGAVCIMDVQTTGVCTLFGAPSPINNAEVVLDQVLIPIAAAAYTAPSCFPLTYKAEIKGSAFKPKAVLIAALRDTTGAVHNAGTPTWEWDGKGNVKILNIPGLTYGRTYEVTFLTF